MEGKQIDIDKKLNCLIIQTAFSKYSYWNYIDSIKMAGFKAYAVPLGLLTVAAILPQHWNFKLVDMNISTNSKISESDWSWADLICIGGMITQQVAMLKMIKQAHDHGKFVMVGGADPSSQPEIYSEADALCLKEGELSIPMWLSSCKQGVCTGVFIPDTKADMKTVPLPRYDLVNLMDYHLLGIQFSRGCPHHCEFCSVIELFGRVPRRKEVVQFINELELIYSMGFRGRVDIVDDNFIGNIKIIKDELLPAMIEWNTLRNNPFMYSAEVSMNIAEQSRLLSQMHKARFRDVFVGIESPDPDVLNFTHKKINLVGSLLERIKKIYEHGLVVHAGFILGFDNEKKGMDSLFIDFIQESGVVLAMMGLLVALPGTQLYKRLKSENRLLDYSKHSQKHSSASSNLDLDLSSDITVADQTTGGLNFKTVRDRVEIYTEYQNIIKNIYHHKNYMKRVLLAMLRLKRRKFIPNLDNIKRDLYCLFVICFKMSFSSACFSFWKTIYILARKDPSKIPLALEYLCLYFHFKKQTNYILKNIDKFKNIDPEQL